jgi:hypothetical protein
LTDTGSGTRAFPFVTADANYLRELHEGGTLAQNGAELAAGGGLLLSFRNRAVGIRPEGGLVVHTRPVSFDRRPHVAPTAGVSFFVNF